jgi:ribonuclease D
MCATFAGAFHLQIEIFDTLPDERLKHYLAQPAVAVDLEMTGLGLGRDHTCLVQLCDASETVTLVRPHPFDAQDALRALFTAAAPVKVFHFAVVDCSFILQDLGVEVANPYCTKIASRIARTYSQEHGLSALVEELTGERIDKRAQTSEWCGDLSEEQLRYAVNDVKYLLPIRGQLEAKLAARGRLPTGITYTELNRRCQAFIPTLVHLLSNGYNSRLNLEERWITDVFWH